MRYHISIDSKGHSGFNLAISHFCRSSAVFNAFIGTLPQTLDQNHLMGGHILPAALQVLLYSPSPANVCSAASENNQCPSYTYTLWRLEPHVRRNWLMSVEVIMYKVNANLSFGSISLVE